MSATPKPIRIVCIGAGYVGGPTMAVIALRCPHITVHVFDIFQSRIDQWNSPASSAEELEKLLPIYEPGLAAAVFAARGRNLFFTADESLLQEADIIFVSVNTPTKTVGVGAGQSADLAYVEGAARKITTVVKGNADGSEKHVIVVEKSTVPVGCARIIESVFAANTPAGVRFSILSNPEFLAEGTAIQDLLTPSRVLIGGKHADAVEALVAVYACWVPRERIITTNLWSSEASKLVANAFLAQRISSINSITPLCERTGADVEEVRRSLSMDPRIGSFFLNPSVGFGGSCFQKDVMNLVYICRSLHLPEVADYWEQVITINEFQKDRFARVIIEGSFGSLRGKAIAIFGFAFKKDTGDTRETPAAAVCARLLVEGAQLRIFDPKVPEATIYADLAEYVLTHRLPLPNERVSNFSAADNEDARPASRVASVAAHIKGNVTVAPSCESAAAGTDGIAIVTEWDMFRDLDYASIIRTMRRPANLYDGRLLLSSRIGELEALGFKVFAIGKPTVSMAAITPSF